MAVAVNRVRDFKIVYYGRMGPLNAAWGRYIRKAPKRLAEDSGNKTEDGEVSIWKFAFSVILQKARLQRRSFLSNLIRIQISESSLPLLGI